MREFFFANLSPVWMRRRYWLVVAGSLLTAVAIALLAYGHHGLTIFRVASLADQTDLPLATKQSGSVAFMMAMGNLNMAASFALYHGIALAALAPLAVRRLAWLALLVMALGVLLFSGSLVASALFAIPLGVAPASWVLTPVGGVLMMLGWVLHALGHWPRGQ